jgi:hypothetical protein
LPGPADLDGTPDESRLGANPILGDVGRPPLVDGLQQFDGGSAVGTE